MSKVRSISANKAYQGWYPAISDHLALTIKEATRVVKLDFGLPILLEHEYLGHVIGNGLQFQGFFKQSRAEQLLEMDKLPVTRLFDDKMHKKLRDGIQHHYGLMGLELNYKGKQA